MLPIRRALLPGYSKLSGDIDELRSVFVDGIGLTLLFVIPLAAGLAATADSLVRILLGPRWLETIPLIHILAFLGCLRACSSNIAPLYVALGRPQLVSRSIAITAAVGVPLIACGGYFGGLTGTAYAVTAAGAFNVVISFAFAARLLRLSATRLIGAVGRTTLATVAMTALVVAIGLWWDQPESTGSAVSKFVAQVSIGGMIFIAALLALWRLWGCPYGPESQIVAVGQKWFATLRARAH